MPKECGPVAKVLKRVDKAMSFGGDDIAKVLLKGRNGNGKG